MNRHAGFLFVGLLIGIFIGGAGGFVLFGGSNDANADGYRTPGGREVRERGGERPAPRTTPESKTPFAPAERNAVREEVRSTDDVGDLEGLSQTLANALAEAPPVEVHRGNAFLEGRVIDHTENPIPGVSVVLSRVDERYSAARVGAGKPKVRSLSDRIRSTVEYHYRNQANRLETTTGSDGRFRWEGLDEGTYNVSVFKQGYQLAVRGSSRVETGDDVLIFGEKLIELPITVAMPGGGPPEYAVIESRPASAQRSKDWSRQKWEPETPNARFESGAFEIRAMLSRKWSRDYDGPDLTSESISITLSADVTPNPASFILRPSLGIRGKVQLSELQPDDLNSRVYLKKIASEADVDLKALAAAERNEWLGSHRPQFEFRDLSAGLYVIGVTRRYDGPIVAHAVVNVVDSIVTQNLVIPSVDSEDHLTVSLLTAEGKPIEDAEFSMERKGRNRSMNSNCYERRLKDGRYVVVPREDCVAFFDEAPEESTTYTLIASTKSHGRKAQLLAKGVRDVTIRFGDQATLHVTVAGFVETEHADILSVQLRSGDGTRSIRNERDWKPDGTLTVGPVEAGSYQLKLEKRDSQSRYQSTTILTQAVALGPGDNSLLLTMPALYDVTVSFPDADIDTSAYLQKDGGTEVTQFTEVDDAKKVTFRDLSPGTYTVHRQGVEMAMMTIEVPGPDSIVFKAQPVNCLIASVEDASSQLGQAGIQTGDKVIAINGKSFETMNELQMTLMAAMSKPKIQMTVLRGRKEFQVELDAKQLMEGMRSENRLAPGTR